MADARADRPRVARRYRREHAREDDEADDARLTVFCVGAEMKKDRRGATAFGPGQKFARRNVTRFGHSSILLSKERRRGGRRLTRLLDHFSSNDLTSGAIACHVAASRDAKIRFVLSQSTGLPMSCRRLRSTTP